MAPGDENFILQTHSSSKLTSRECVSCKDMVFNKESERIKSFTEWPINSPVDPERLAKAGFYYSGTGEEAVCFSCHGCIKDWNYGDIVLKKHAEMFPDCDFIKHRSNNIPVVKNSKSNGELKAMDDIFRLSKHSGLKNNFDFEKMKSENERLKTFAGKWQLTYINAVEISRAGFFYLGFDDKVQCPYCKVILSGWEAGDDPFEEHLTHYPSCDFFSNFEHIKTKIISYGKNSQDICGNRKISPNYISSKKKLLDENQQHKNLEALGVHLHKGPAHPQQASIDARLRSFFLWSATAPVSKETLAEAGFFYIGISDHTKCFHCDGGLCNWEYGDDPWIEHARWFRNCDFLRLNKGNEFIQQCCKKYHSTTCVETKQQQSSDEHSSTKQLMQKVDEAMKSELTEHVMETGLFPSYIIRAAILRQIKEKGSSFSNIDDLCVAVSCLKEEMEKEPLQMKNVGAEDLNIMPSAYFSNDETVGNIVIPPNVFQAQINSSHGIEKNNQELKEDTSKDHCLCKICMDKEVSIVFLPCGHLLSCAFCAPALKICPMCRKTIQATVRAYLN